MKAVRQICQFEAINILRSKWLIFYALLFFLVAEGLLRFGGSEIQASISLTNVVLLFVPLVSLVFGTSYLFSSREFTELILTQPVNRTSLFFGLFSGLASTLTLGFVVGMVVPFALRFSTLSDIKPIVVLVVFGVFLTLIFVSIAFLIAALIEDKVKAMGVALFVWFGMSLLFDGIVLAVVQIFRYYPLETPIVAMMIANPVDLARVSMLLVLDASAMMGYTGATIERFIGSTPGVILCSAALLLWIAIPLFAAWRTFERKDF